MRKRAVWWAVSAFCVVAALPACSRSAGRSVPSATVGTAPPQTTTTDPYAVPAIIDATYVSRVIAGLDAITGDIVRLVVSTRTIPREAFDRLKALYVSDSAVQREIDGYEADMADGLTSYKPNPGNKKTTVTELITAGKSCVFARVERDFTAVGVSGRKGIVQWVALQPADASRDPHGYNTTGWAYANEGTTPQGTQPKNPCVAQ